MSKAAIIRQSILLALLGVALALLVWEFVVAKPGYVRAQTHLTELQERYLGASSKEVNGDANGEGIAEEYTAEMIEAVLGSPAKVEPKGDGVELRYYQWRRGNLYQTYQLWVLFTARGPNNDKWVFTDWYDDESAIPATLARAENPENTIEMPENGPVGVNQAGGGGPGEGGERPRRNRANGPGGGAEGNSESSETPTPTPTETEAGSGDAPEEGDGNG